MGKVGNDGYIRVSVKRRLRGKIAVGLQICGGWALGKGFEGK